MNTKVIPVVFFLVEKDVWPLRNNAFKCLPLRKSTQPEQKSCWLGTILRWNAKKNIFNTYSYTPGQKLNGKVGYPWESTRHIYQHIPPIQSNIWIIYWLYRARWGNIRGTTARVPCQGYPTFPFEKVDGTVTMYIGLYKPSQLTYLLFSRF